MPTEMNPTAEQLTSEQRNLLLYLESRAVDNNGLVDGRQMNESDMEIAKEWNESGYVQFGRLKTREMKRLGYSGTHYVRLTTQAWIDVHAEREARSNWMIAAWEKKYFRPGGRNDES